MTMLASIPKRVDMEDGDKLGALNLSNRGPVLLIVVTILCSPILSHASYRKRNQRSRPNSSIPRKPRRISVAPGVSLPSWEWASVTSICDVTGLWKLRRKDRISGINTWLPLKDLY